MSMGDVCVRSQVELLAQKNNNERVHILKHVCVLLFEAKGLTDCVISDNCFRSKKWIGDVFNDVDSTFSITQETCTQSKGWNIELKTVAEHTCSDTYKIIRTPPSKQKEIKMYLYTFSTTVTGMLYS